MNAATASNRSRQMMFVAGIAPFLIGLFAVKFVDPVLVWGGTSTPPLVLFLSVGAMAVVDWLTAD